jgi:hypothetical protein
MKDFDEFDANNRVDIALDRLLVAARQCLLCNRRTGWCSVPASAFDPVTTLESSDDFLNAPCKRFRTRNFLRMPTWHLLIDNPLTGQNKCIHGFPGASILEKMPAIQKTFSVNATVEFRRIFIAFHPFRMAT